MLFRFIVPVFTPNEAIREGTQRELSAEEATLYAGNSFNHLEPVDAEARAFLDALKGGKPYEVPVEVPVEVPKEPTRAELIEEAKVLGIKGADAMKKDDLSVAIAAAKA